jgi:crossover junction endodeoxyribonuclease RuvC
MMVLGVDPGSRLTGYGIVSSEGNRVRCLQYGAISPGKGKSLPAIPERLHLIQAQLEKLVHEFSPQVMAVEGVFYATNVKSALVLGYVRGIVLLTAARCGVRLVEYSPLEVKKAVAGYGRADKLQVQKMVQLLLNLREKPQPHDAADALAIALCHTFSSGLERHSQGRWHKLQIPQRQRRN